MTSATLLAETIEAVLGHLRGGGVVSFPTDTLYALAADATNDAAVARVFAVKKRLLSNPLPLFVSDIDQAATVGEVTTAARALALRFWPGALTIVIPKRPDFHSLALAGGETVALRAPDHALALAILRGLGRPVTATSANLSGGANPSTAEDVASQLGSAVDFIVDGGSCPVGDPSTIVDCSRQGEVAILRQGAIPEAEIRASLATTASR